MCLTVRVGQRKICIKISSFNNHGKLSPTLSMTRCSGAEKQGNTAATTAAVRSLCYMKGDFITLHRHEVRKVPDEFANDVLLPLLVKDVVVALQHGVLVLLREHHRWILARARTLISPRAFVVLQYFQQVYFQNVQISSDSRILTV